MEKAGLDESFLDPRNHRAAVGLHFAHYNFVRQHKTLRVSHAMAAGVSDRMWSLEELIGQTS